MSALRLRVRTPLGLLVDREVQSIRAEDLDGWFGIRPGRAELASVMPPGLLVFRAPEGERYVALAGGLLALRADECRVLTADASVFETLEAAAEGARAQQERQRERGQRQRDALFELAREAYRRLARLPSGP